MAKIPPQLAGPRAIIKTFAVIFVFYPLYLLSFLFPRRKDLWLFGNLNGAGYGDNAKWLFEWCLEHKKNNVEAIWITRNKQLKAELVSAGRPCFYAYSLKGIFASLRAGAFVYTHSTSDINFWFGGGAVRVNLWHGSPMKKIGRDVVTKGSMENYLFTRTGISKVWARILVPGAFEQPEIFFAASSIVGKRHKDAYNLPAGAIQILGYPRNDALFLQEQEHKDLGDFKELAEARKNGKKLVIYLPTFRERVESAQEDSARNRFLEKIESQGVSLVVKSHPFDTNTFLSEGKGEISLPSSTDIYPLLKYCDALITDYSSIAFDYMLLDRPIIYFAYDLDKYESIDREFYMKFEDVAGGVIVETYEELTAVVIAQVVEGKDPAKIIRTQLKHEYNQNIEGNYSSAAYKIISDRVGL